MTTYIVIWLIAFASSLSGIFGKYGKPQYSKGLILLLLLLLACIVAFRVDVGLDWSSYKLFYYSGYAYDKPDGSVEPLFGLVRDFCYYLGFSHAIFFLILSYFSLYILYKAACIMNIKNHFILFFVYLSLFYCSLQFNIFRTAIMASCLWLAFAYVSKNNIFKGILWCLLASGFHYIAILFLPLLFFISVRLNLKWFYGILFGAILLFIINFSASLTSYFPWLLLIDRVENYVDVDEAESYGMSLGMGFNVCLCAALRYFYRSKYDENKAFRILLNVLLINNFLVLSLNSLGIIVARIGQSLNIAAIFIWPFVFSNLKIGRLKTCIGVFFVLYLALFYYKTWGGEDSDTRKMLPYTMDVLQLFDTHL